MDVAGELVQHQQQCQRALVIRRPVVQRAGLGGGDGGGDGGGGDGGGEGGGGEGGGEGGPAVSGGGDPSSVS